MATNYVEFKNNQVIDLTLDYNRQLALVDITVLKKLTALLPMSDFGAIRHNFREQIMNTSNLEQLVQASEDFIAFHRTVNLINEVNVEDVNQIQEEDEVEVIGKIDLDDIRPSKSY